MKTQTKPALRGITFIKAPSRSAQADSAPVTQAVADILRNVREKGDAAVRDYGNKFDKMNVGQFEVSMVEGQRTYDLLFDLLDPKLVKYQFQMSTINSGLVAADYFLRYPGRFISMHVQDVDLEAHLRDGRRPQAAAGKGGINWVKTFHAAKTGGIKNYFVEQNWELTQQSVAYLKTLTV